MYLATLEWDACPGDYIFVNHCVNQVCSRLFNLENLLRNNLVSLCFSSRPLFLCSRFTRSLWLTWTPQPSDLDVGVWSVMKLLHKAVGVLRVQRSYFISEGGMTVELQYVAVCVPGHTENNKCFWCLRWNSNAKLTKGVTLLPKASKGSAIHSQSDWQEHELQGQAAF